MHAILPAGLPQGPRFCQDAPGNACDADAGVGLDPATEGRNLRELDRRQALRLGLLFLTWRSRGNCFPGSKS